MRGLRSPVATPPHPANMGAVGVAIWVLLRGGRGCREVNGAAVSLAGAAPWTAEDFQRHLRDERVEAARARALP